MSKKNIEQIARVEHMQLIHDLYESLDMDHPQIASNQIAIPAVIDGEELWVRVTVSIPKGSRDGIPFDGYLEAGHYEDDMARKAEKAEAQAAAKAKKIARDEKRRAALAEKNE